jgi:hypothetical protein
MDFLRHSQVVLFRLLAGEVPQVTAEMVETVLLGAVLLHRPRQGRGAVAEVGASARLMVILPNSRERAAVSVFMGRVQAARQGYLIHPVRQPHGVAGDLLLQRHPH